MKKIILSLTFSLLILFSSNSAALSYYFATDVETQVLTLTDKTVELIVTQHDSKNRPEVYPIGTILRGKFFEYNFKRRLMRDEYVKIHFYEAKLPDGSTEKMDNDIKVRPRVLVSSKHNLQLLGAAAGAALKVTIAVWSVGFPVGRGAKAVIDAAYGVYNTPSRESRWKQGVKGFTKGILFPLPEIFMKGEEVAMHDESYLWIQDADEDEKKLTAFVVKRKNIFLSRDKYYNDKGEEVPDWTKYLNDKNMAKYQKKLAKKGVSAKVQPRDPDTQENLVERRKPAQEKIEVEYEEPTAEEISEAQEMKEDMELAEENAKLKKQDLTIKPHRHVWERTWRRPKVKFQDAR
jgi:hypothetical protein